MWYWIIMFLLAAGCAGMLAVTFISIKKQKAEKPASRRRGRRAAGTAARSGEEQIEAPRRRPVRQPSQAQGGQQCRCTVQVGICLRHLPCLLLYAFNTLYSAVSCGIAKGVHPFSLCFPRRPRAIAGVWGVGSMLYLI